MEPNGLARRRRLLAKDVPTTPVEPPVHRKSRQIQRRLNSAQVDQLIADYRAGASVAAVARRYRIDHKTATRHLTTHGIEIRQQRVGIAPEQLPEVRELRIAGWSYERIGQRFGCSRTAVYNALQSADRSS